MSKKSEWICSSCGTVNKNEINVCYKCGNLRQIQEEKKADGKRAAKPVKIAAVLCVGLLLVFLLASTMVHSSANRLAEEGKYGEAAALAKYDLLFSSELREDALIEVGVELYREKEYSEAIELLSQFPQNNTALDYLNMSKAELINIYMEEEKYAKAVELAEQLQDTETFKGSTSTRDKAYLGRAQQLLAQMELQDMADMLGKMSNDTYAQQYIQAIEDIQQGNYSEAALALKESSGYGTGQISESEWIPVFRQIREENLDADISIRIKIEKALNVFEYKPDFDGGSSDYLSFSAPENQKFQDDKHTMVSLEELEAYSIGEGDKILVLWEIQRYESSQTDYYIAWDIMSKLPSELFPDNLDEVGQVVRIICSGGQEGWYNSSNGEIIDAVIESARVVAGDGISRSNIYSSSKFYGPACPNSIWYIPENNLIFGGIPNTDVREAVYAALCKVIG